MKIFFAAGEVSGDRFAAELATALKSLVPDAELVGIGSGAMAAAGVRVLLDLTPTASIGITEALRRLPRALLLLFRSSRLLRNLRPDAFVPVDCQGYNLHLAARARKLGIPVLYYIPPQNFFWDDRKTGKRVSRLADRLLCIYRKGQRFYSELGADAVFVGHPLLDRFPKPLPAKESPVRSVFLAPGTRVQEMRRLLPVLLGAAARLYRDNPSLQFRMAAVDAVHARRLRSAARGMGLSVVVEEASLGTVCSGCTLYIGKSGTASLEAALAGVPSILLYKLSRTSYFLLSKIAGLAKRLPFIGLPNLLIGREVVPEFLQKEANQEAVYRAAAELLHDRGLWETQRRAFEGLRPLLGEGGVAGRAAEEVFRFVREREG